MSSYRSNLEKAWADKVNRGSQVNAQESMNAQGVAARNVQRLGAADERNAQIDAQADMIDMQNRGAKSNFLGAGIKGIADISAMANRDAQANETQEFIKGLMGLNKKKE